MITVDVDRNDATRNVIKAYKAKEGASGAAVAQTRIVRRNLQRISKRTEGRNLSSDHCNFGIDMI